MSKTAPPMRTDYKIFYPISTRWSDNDIYGHVNNVSHLEWALESLPPVQAAGS